MLIYKYLECLFPILVAFLQILCVSFKLTFNTIIYKIKDRAITQWTFLSYVSSALELFYQTIVIPNIVNIIWNTIIFGD